MPTSHLHLLCLPDLSQDLLSPHKPATQHWLLLIQVPLLSFPQDSFSHIPNLQTLVENVAQSDQLSPFAQDLRVSQDAGLRQSQESCDD